jgi:hypothetical protein
MAFLLPDVALEAEVGLVQKFGRHTEIHLRVPEMDVAEVDRQMMNQPLYIRALPIPGRETVNRERVT